MQFKDEIQCLSFQGVAAGLIHGTTIHSFLGLNMQGNMKPESYSNLNKKLKTKRVFLEDEKSFKGKRFAVKESNILKKAANSTKGQAGKC